VSLRPRTIIIQDVVQPKVFHCKAGFARPPQVRELRHALQLIRPTGRFRDIF
jgi:hypothetical protein